MMATGVDTPAEESSLRTASSTTTSRAKPARYAEVTHWKPIPASSRVQRMKTQHGKITRKKRTAAAPTPPQRGTRATMATRYTAKRRSTTPVRSEEHTSELQSRENLVCRLL